MPARLAWLQAHKLKKLDSPAGPLISNVIKLNRKNLLKRKTRRMNKNSLEDVKEPINGNKIRNPELREEVQRT